MSIHEDWKDPEAAKRGMSPAVKVLLIVGAVGGFFLLLCCGGVGLFAWKAKDVLQQFGQLGPLTVANDIRTLAGRIAQIDLPPDFEPTFGFELGIMRWVGYERMPRDGSRLMLFELDKAMLQTKTLPEQRREIERMLQQQSSQNNQFEMQINVTDRETREVTVRGEPVEFEFNKGTTPGDGKAVRQALGAIRTPGGVALLNLIVPEEGYDEPAVIKMIESIRDPIPDSDADDGADDMQDADDKPEDKPANVVDPVDKDAGKEAAGSQTN